MTFPSLLITAMASLHVVDAPPTIGANSFYHPNPQPLHQTPLVRLPLSSFKPGGFVRKSLELQRDGLAGHLGEISVWLTKKNNAWLNPSGEGDYGWEEVPYWLRGYVKIAFLLKDRKMIDESNVWIEGTIASARPDGDFGPKRFHREGMRDLWAQMLMLQTLQTWQEETGDPRVIPLMTRYFRWQLAIPDDHFLRDYWENSRGGDNLASVYWLYNRTREPFLLELATKIDRCTANWRREGTLPNFHNVNVAECFRAPATYAQQSGKKEDIQASYRAHDLIREMYGQVPGGMFGADENARAGYVDPRQATETCGFVEQIGSNNVMASITADPKWVANTEDVAFNSMPAAFMPDYKALRYLTAPNMTVCDSKNHAPGIANEGPFLMMNPFSSRCCQHNHTSAWTNYLEGTWMATQDNGLAALSFTEGTVKAKVGKGNEVEVKTTTRYPFDGKVALTVKAKSPVEFPLYVLIPTWAEGAKATTPEGTEAISPGKYLVITREWKDGDKVTIQLPMSPSIRAWDKNKGSGSVDYGPLTFSLRIEEDYHKIDGLKSTQRDSGWQPGVDQSKWPAHEITPGTAWNFGLSAAPEFKVIKRAWPKNNAPFTLENAPLEIQAWGRKIPGWGIDGTGLTSVLPQSPVETAEPQTRLTLIPMGCARLRISAFPRVK